jgi:hypothetical protein
MPRFTGENQLYPRNPRAINIVASLQYIFSQREKILQK